ncbi:MAG: FAD-dependent oxidoreductase [Planctomycetaceae bacterium]|nr:FAD-dependent oxidoreductase [Planctomycetaceae bacterium]
MAQESRSGSTFVSPVVVLGAGVNGSAVARELVLNGVPVVVVDAGDIARGATSGSSRLIHGGLRYLEYGDVELVRESLRERSRLARLAPQFVQPLELAIPVEQQTGGLLRSAFRFLGSARSPLLNRIATRIAPEGARGLWLVRAGLWMYDRFAADSLFPAHRVTRNPATARTGAGSAAIAGGATPAVDARRFPWLCHYTDGQMRFPERFTLALLQDAAEAAEELAVPFEVLAGQQAELHGTELQLTCRRTGAVRQFTPAAIVNTTGAWGDLTLAELGVPSRRLFGGTRGSHLLLNDDGLRDALGGSGVYAEAADGRLVFVLPFGELVLVGTTDIPFTGRPETARCSEEEIHFLLGLVQELFPALTLNRGSVDSHYSAVRPLPAASAASAGAVSRGHWIEQHPRLQIPLLTLVGGKLTTARASAAQVADAVLDALRLRRTADTGERPVPGAEHWPESPTEVPAWRQALADRFQLPVEQIQRMTELCGSRCESILEQGLAADTAGKESGSESEAGGESVRGSSSGELAGTRSGFSTAQPRLETLPETGLPRCFVEHILRTEWVGTLEDLVFRRLMLLYRPGLTYAALEELATVMVDCGMLPPEDRAAAAAGTARSLRDRHGKQLQGAPAALADSVPSRKAVS